MQPDVVTLQIRALAALDLEDVRAACERASARRRGSARSSQ
jgi:hypothetical protein